MKWGVVVFPGSNCDYDTFYVLRDVMEQDVEFIWHEERNLRRFDVIILPGGFSYGDYLRPGALARFSPVVDNLANFIESGKFVIGICNGFQILTEAGFLPGALLPNVGGRFICKWVELEVVNRNTPFTKVFSDKIIKMPIAHYRGRYVVDNETLRTMVAKDMIVFKYVENPNGSVADIAGVVNEKGNVLGMMPHPERASEPILGGTLGRIIWESVLR